MGDDVYWDPFDRQLHESPHEVWRRMRDEAPVYRNDRYDFYALSRHDDVVAASLDPHTFSSEHGITIDAIGPEPTGDPKPMIMMDPPRHTHFRKMVNRTFTPRRMSKIEDRIRELCVGYLDPFVGSGGFDYVTDFSARLPVMVISSLLGFPEEDHDQLRVWSDAQLHRDEGESEVSAEGKEAFEKLIGYYYEQVTLRRDHPQDDIVSEMMAAEIDDGTGERRHLEDPDLLAFIALINIAGNETVARLLGWAAMVLHDHPGERAKLVEHPELIPNAVEELLRYEAPSPVQGRFTLAPATFHGTTIPAGAKVALITGSAGRDERHYADPDRFDVERTDIRHVSFGHGAHFCLGAALARVEAKIALEETLKRFPAWEVEREGVEFVHTNSVRGPASVPITW